MEKYHLLEMQFNIAHNQIHEKESAIISLNERLKQTQHEVIEVKNKLSTDSNGLVELRQKYDMVCREK